MNNVYHIREGGGRVTESSLPEVARLIDEGKLKFTGKKIKQKRVVHEFEDHSESEIVLTTYRFYIRGNFPRKADSICDGPCCEYVRKGLTR